MYWSICIYIYMSYSMAGRDICKTNVMAAWSLTHAQNHTQTYVLVGWTLKSAIHKYIRRPIQIAAKQIDDLKSYARVVSQR